MTAQTREEIESRFEVWRGAAAAVRAVISGAGVAVEQMVLWTASVERGKALRELEETEHG